MKSFKTVIATTIASSSLFFGAMANADVLISNFNDGTTQGWSESNPLNPGDGFNGDLEVLNFGGNPGGYMRARDTVSAGGSLAVLAPSPLFGDLSALGYVRWDTLLPSDPSLSTSALVEGIDGTLFRSNNSVNPFTPSGNWFTKTASFTSPLGWTRISGSASFQSVMSNAVALYIELDVTQRLGVEAGIDNVRIKDSDPDPVSTCPENSDLHIQPEAGGGLCTTALASIPTVYSTANSIDWSWALGGHSGDVTNQGQSPTTVSIYHPSGNWTNYYLVVRADIELANGARCEIWNHVLLDCGTGPGGGNQR